MVAGGAAQAVGLGSRQGIAELLLAGLILALAIALCTPALQGLSYLWNGSQFYGHGYVVPVMAAYLAYARRASLVAAWREGRPPALGPLVVFVCGSAEALAVIGDVGFAAGLGIPLLLGAVAYAIAGLPLLRPLLLPLGFLALMVPPPRFLTYEILFQLKLLVTRAAVTVLQSAGATVLAEGNAILIPNHTLFVADACSGLTSIVAIMPLACIVAYFLSHGVWRRIAVIASVLPLVMAANVLRVVVTVTLVSHVGVGAAQGSLHQSFGLLTSVLGTLAVIGVARLLR